MKTRIKIFLFCAAGAIFLVAGLFVRSQTHKPATVPLPQERVYEPHDMPSALKPVIPPQEASGGTNTALPPLSTSAQKKEAAMPPFPLEVNLAIPFTSQAPFANWDAVHEEFCEEASSVMAAAFVLGKPMSGPDDAEARLQDVKRFEEGRFGYFEDTTAEETALILREHFGIGAVSVVPDPTIPAMREALASGKAVILPAAGRELGNPYFTQPGPLYHMLVVKGYTKDGRFITNDPGTRRGANYLYDASVLLNAVHDWNGGDVMNGRKVMIVVG